MENTTLYQSIINQDYTLFKNSLNDISDITYDPIFLIIDTFTEEHKIGVARMMIQELINKQISFDKTILEFTPLLESINQNSGKARLIKFTMETKSYNNTESMIPQRRRIPDALPIVPNASGSNYSTQELLQLKQIAHELGIHTTTNTNLALKIIHNLRNQLNQRQK